MSRKLFVPLIVFAIVAAFSTSCQKDAIISEPEQKSFSPEAVVSMDEAYKKASMYNDTLAECSHSHSMMHNSQHAGLAAHCDEMFHHYDSVFTAMHHNHCQHEHVNCCTDSMNMHGMMGNSNMDTTSGSGGMSGNGSMGGSSGSMGNSGSGSGMGGGGMNGSNSGGMGSGMNGSGMGGNNGSGMDSSGTSSGGMMNGGMMGGHMMNSNHNTSECMQMDCSGHMAAMDSLRTLHQQFCPR